MASAALSSPMPPGFSTGAAGSAKTGFSVSMPKQHGKAPDLHTAQDRTLRRVTGRHPCNRGCANILTASCKHACLLQALWT